MILIDIYITEFESRGKFWAGIDIKARSWEEAQKYITQHGLDYLTLVGKAYFNFYMFEFN
jgi:hypothetical protein